MSCLPKENGETVDLQPLFFNMTIDSATDFLLGQSVNCQGAPHGSAPWEFSEAFEYAESVLHHRGELGKLALLLRDRKFDAACKTVHDFTDKYILEALKGDTKPGRYNLLTEIARECRDPIRIRDELLNVLLAARDTTAGLLSSVFYLLARSPETWNKLSQEVEKLNDEIPDYAALKDMPYLKAVLNESKSMQLKLRQKASKMTNRKLALRLLPPVPINQRYTRKDTVLPHGGGPDGKSPMFAAKGSRVFYSVYAMHRLPEIWGPDAQEYRPERWLDEKNPLRPGWGFLVSLNFPRYSRSALSWLGWPFSHVTPSLQSME